jgi:CRP-like cAMP-binding protein
MTTTPDPTANGLLSALSRKTFDRLTRHLDRLTLAQRHPVSEPGAPIEYVYFPVSCVVSLVAVMADEKEAEVATVGREGLVGMSVFWGVGTMPMRAFVQVPGDAYRVGAAAFRAEAAPGGELAGLLLRYTQALFHQVARSAACNQSHSVAKRCARWLLMSHDRAGREQFELTQEFLGQMLGVRRAGIGEAAGALQKAGHIKYARGRITVVDRAGLESASCECYRAIRDEYLRLVGAPEPPT